MVVEEFNNLHKKNYFILYIFDWISDAEALHGNFWEKILVFLCIFPVLLLHIYDAH